MDDGVILHCTLRRLDEFGLHYAVNDPDGNVVSEGTSSTLEWLRRDVRHPDGLHVAPKFNDRYGVGGWRVRFDLSVPTDDENPLVVALRRFGWECGPEFFRRYHSDPWVFNLANAVEALTAEVERLRAERDEWRDAHHAEVES